MIAFPVRVHSPGRGQGEGVPAFGELIHGKKLFLGFRLGVQCLFIKYGFNYSPPP